MQANLKKKRVEQLKKIEAVLSLLASFHSQIIKQDNIQLLEATSRKDQQQYWTKTKYNI